VLRGQVQQITRHFPPGWYAVLSAFSPLPVPFPAELEYPNTFFATSSSSVKRPTNRSNSAIRSCFLVLPLTFSLPKHFRRSFQKLLLPARQHRVFDLIFPTGFQQTFFSRSQFQDYFGFEFRTEFPAIYHSGPLSPSLPSPKASVQFLGSTTDS